MFYSPKGHHAAFALPPTAVRQLEKPRPTLQDVSADLEEIMAYGEEEDGGNSIDPSGQMWEADVRVKVFEAEAFTLQIAGCPRVSAEVRSPLAKSTAILNHFTSGDGHTAKRWEGTSWVDGHVVQITGSNVYRKGQAYGSDPDLRMIGCEQNTGKLDGRCGNVLLSRNHEACRFILACGLAVFALNSRRITLDRSIALSQTGSTFIE